MWLTSEKNVGVGKVLLCCIHKLRYAIWLRENWWKNCFRLVDNSSQRCKIQLRFHKVLVSGQYITINWYWCKVYYDIISWLKIFLQQRICTIKFYNLILDMEKFLEWFIFKYNFLFTKMGKFLEWFIFKCNFLFTKIW